jgi:hypothetical protein
LHPGSTSCYDRARGGQPVERTTVCGAACCAVQHAGLAQSPLSNAGPPLKRPLALALVIPSATAHDCHRARLPPRMTATMHDCAHASGDQALVPSRLDPATCWHPSHLLAPRMGSASLAASHLLVPHHRLGVHGCFGVAFTPAEQPPAPGGAPAAHPARPATAPPHAATPQNARARRRAAGGTHARGARGLSFQGDARSGPASAWSGFAGQGSLL